MPVRRLPVRPNLEQLQRQAKEFLHAIHTGDPNAIAELREHHPEPIEPSAAKLADAHLVLARSYGVPSWTRLVQAVQLSEAIWSDDLDKVRALITQNPQLIRDQVLIRPDSNWGPPMTYAANLGRDRIIRLLHGYGARDLESAAGRAALQGKVDTLYMIYDLAGRPSLNSRSFAGPAYTLSVEGTAAMLGLGARPVGPDGVDRNTMEHLLGTDSRNPPAKHRILELYVEHGFEPPDTPVMALHRGRIDLLEAHLERHPDLLTRTFDITDIFPLAPACSREPYTAQGSTVVSQRNFWVNYGKGQPDEARFTRLLLDRGADPDMRASLRARLEEGHGGGPLREYRNVTPLGWGEQYHARIFVSKESLRLIEANGGGR